MKFAILYLLRSRKKISRKLFIRLRLIKKRKEGRHCFNRQEDEWVQESFDIANLTEHECWKLFRFRKADIFRLQTSLRIPDVVRTDERDRACGIEALCIVLRRLAYPNRWLELRGIFGRDHASLQRLFYRTLRLIDRFSPILQSWNLPWLSEEDFAIYAAAIAAKGGPIRNVFGFIDGTARPICRPTYFQRQMYSGHKRIHCIKWQAVILPNGIICNLFGGERGTMHDSRLLAESRLLATSREKQATWTTKYTLYGDAGYGTKDHLHRPFSNLEVSQDQRKGQINKAMSSVRQAAEWGFGGVVGKFSFVDYRKQMKLCEKPVNLLFRIAVLLTNIHNCMYPNQTSLYFDLDPPELEEYLFIQ